MMPDWEHHMRQRKTLRTVPCLVAVNLALPQPVSLVLVAMAASCAEASKNSAPDCAQSVAMPVA